MDYISYLVNMRNRLKPLRRDQNIIWILQFQPENPSLYLNDIDKIGIVTTQKHVQPIEYENWINIDSIWHHGLSSLSSRLYPNT